MSLESCVNSVAFLTFYAIKKEIVSSPGHVGGQKNDLRMRLGRSLRRSLGMRLRRSWERNCFLAPLLVSADLSSTTTVTIKCLRKGLLEEGEGYH